MITADFDSIRFARRLRGSGTTDAKPEELA
jgi:hypothetical protein